jgi:1,4-dihydroxy-2-naphthoate octaprenyltransferase
VRALGAFIRLARLPFLLGGFVAFALGAAVARFDGHPLDWGTYLFGQLIVTSFHLMVHFDNDYFDQESDSITTRTAWSGGSGVISGDELPQNVALFAGRGCQMIGLVATIEAIFVGNIALGIVGIAIMFFAWFYSVPPVRLLERGLGELDGVLVVSVLVPLAGYTAFAHGIGPHVLLAILPGACAMFAMMLSVEIPDAPADRITGKRNLVVRWGVAYAAIVARTFATFAVMTLILIAGGTFAPPVLAYLAIIPPALVAGAYATPHLVAHLEWATIPFLGVAIFGLTTAAMAVITVCGWR